MPKNAKLDELATDLVAEAREGSAMSQQTERVCVERSVRAVLHLPSSFPWRSAWQRLAWRVHAALT